VIKVEQVLGRTTAAVGQHGALAAGGVGGRAPPPPLPRSLGQRPLVVVGRLALVDGRNGGRRGPAAGGVDALDVVDAAHGGIAETVSVGESHGGGFSLF